MADITRADSLYYLAARLRPRDPEAREALGGYLAMRGASRIAAVLLEEARMFGGDPARIAAQLAPVYASLGDWRALLSLPGSSLTGAERKRAAWLTEHPSDTRADSTSLPLIGTIRGDTLGRITIRVGGKPATAVLLARDVGVTLGGLVAARGVTHFAGDNQTVVLDSINIGAARLTRIPATVDPASSIVVIGLGALRQMSVTFDYSQKRVFFNQLRGMASVQSLPLVRNRGELQVAERTPVRWSSLASYLAAANARQGPGPVTVDLKAGEIRIPY